MSQSNRLTTSPQWLPKFNSEKKEIGDITENNIEPCVMRPKALL